MIIVIAPDHSFFIGGGSIANNQFTLISRKHSNEILKKSGAFLAEVFGGGRTGGTDGLGSFGKPQKLVYGNRAYPPTTDQDHNVGIALRSRNTASPTNLVY